MLSHSLPLAQPLAELPSSKPTTQAWMTTKMKTSPLPSLPAMAQAIGVGLRSGPTMVGFVLSTGMRQPRLLYEMLEEQSES